MKEYRLTETTESEGLPYTFGKAVLDHRGFHRHTHNYSELIVITSGRGLHTAEGQTYPVGTGDIFVINRGQSHSFSRDENLAMYNLGFKEDITRLPGLDELPGIKVLFELEPRSRNSKGFKSRFHANPGQMEKIESTLQEMEKELEERKPGYKLLFQNLFIKLVILLARDYSDTGFPAGRNLIKIAGCLLLIEERFAEKIDINSLAKDNGLSTAHFIRSFSSIYGLTPLQYIIKLRLSRAVELLENSDMNISEIGFSCGFEDSNYFSRVFRKQLGISPREFRKAENTQINKSFFQNTALSSHII